MRGPHRHRERPLRHRAAKLPADLAARAQQLLDDRVWQELKAFGDMRLTGRSYATAKDTWC